MKYTTALLALATTALANPLPQGVTESISPEASAPEGCSPDAPGTFNIQVVNVTSSAAKAKRQLAGILTLTLAGGILKDQAGRTGYTAANDQFQFDAPPQTGAVYTAGFSLCSNKSLALGGTAIWWQCLSGEFYNLYFEKQGNQCNEVYIVAINGGGSGAAATQAADGQPAETGAVTQIADGQPQETPVSQIADGQPQVPVSQIADGQPQVPVSQIADGQPQAPVSQIADGQPQAPVSQIADGQPQAPTGAVSQIADGQPQAPTGVPVSQIADGQPQAPTGAPVSQISDGQPQAPTGKPVSQISDGQPQAPTGAPVSQISDGQPQAPAQTGAPASQISDGQVQAPTGTPAAYTGGMPRATVGLTGLLAAGVVGAAALL